MDILNSPLVIVIFVGLIAAVIGVRHFTGADRRCPSCRKGLMQEKKATPEGMLDASNPNAGSTVVRYQVEYACDHCGEKLVRSESRS